MEVMNRRDTKAWRAQVWISFGIAAFLCGVGLGHLPGQDLDRAFMVMGYVFCVTSAFVLAKFIRDNQWEAVDTPLWRMVVYSSFVSAMALTAWGLWRMNINDAYKAFMMVAWLYLLTSTFTLAKTLRDAHEADLADIKQAAREQARAELAGEQRLHAAK